MKISTLTWLVLLFSNSVFGQELKLTTFEEIECPLDNFQRPTAQRKLPDTIRVGAFEMSEFITWKQFKIFLEDTRRIKGKRVAKQYTPRLDAEMLFDRLTTTEFDDLPVVGVSWTTAKEYGRWRTIVDNDHSIEFTYDLPLRSEWLAALHLLKSKKKKHDLNKNYADWTNVSKDESMYEWASSSDARIDYQFDALSDDPPVMKRKIAIGASFKLRLPFFADYNQSYYQDSSYSHIGFRLVKHPTSYTDISCYEDWLSELLLPYAKYKYLLNEENTILDGAAIKYGLYNNRLCGKYVSTYSNGQLKADGQFYKNQRIGTWIVWDSLGKKLLERHYTNSHHYLQVFPRLTDPQAETLRAERTQPLQRDKDNLFSYHFIEERAVHWAKRLWTEIAEEDNPSLFDDDRLINLLSITAKEKTITIYSPTTDYFKDTISYEEFSSKRVGRIVAFEIKEDFFMDMDRGISGTRPIGICPMSEIVIDGDTSLQAMGWFYFPEIRETLSKSYSSRNRCYSNPRMIGRINPRGKQTASSKSLDDLFFLRDYAWNTMYETSVEGKRPFNPEDTGWNFRLKQIEQEHDFWIYINTIE